MCFFFALPKFIMSEKKKILGIEDFLSVEL